MDETVGGRNGDARTVAIGHDDGDDDGTISMRRTAAGEIYEVRDGPSSLNTGLRSEIVGKIDGRLRRKVKLRKETGG